MAKNPSAPTLSLQERSSSSFGAEEKFSRWVIFSLLFHLALIGGLFIVPFLPKNEPPEYPVYTVDLVGGEKIGRANLGTELKASSAAREAAKKETPASVQESKREAKKEKAEKSKPVEKVALEKTALVPDKIAVQQSTKKETVKKESANQAKTESKSETASLENMRERLIQSAVERVKNRTETGSKTSKGEEISSGTGEGQGAAALGPGGSGGGVPKGIDFRRYESQMLTTIKNNWVWVGQRSNLMVMVHFNIKDNGEIVGLKLMQPSGNSSYDDSVLRAIRKSSPLPAPPEAVRKDFFDVELKFRPEDLGA